MDDDRLLDQLKYFAEEGDEVTVSGENERTFSYSANVPRAREDPISITVATPSWWRQRHLEKQVALVFASLALAWLVAFLVAWKSMARRYQSNDYNLVNWQSEQQVEHRVEGEPEPQAGTNESPGASKTTIVTSLQSSLPGPTNDAFVAPISMRTPRSEAQQFVAEVHEYSSILREEMTKQGILIDDRLTADLAIRRVEFREKQSLLLAQEMRGYSFEAYNRQTDRRQRDSHHRETLSVHSEVSDWLSTILEHRSDAERAVLRSGLWSIVGTGGVHLFRWLNVLLASGAGGLYQLGLTKLLALCTDSRVINVNNSSVARIFGMDYFPQSTSLLCYGQRLGESVAGLLTGLIVLALAPRLPAIVQTGLSAASLLAVIRWLSPEVLVSISFTLGLAATVHALVLFVVRWKTRRFIASLKGLSRQPQASDMIEPLEWLDWVSGFVFFLPVAMTSIEIGRLRL